MRREKRFVTALVVFCLASRAFGQGVVSPQLTQEQIVDKASASVAMVMSRRTSGEPFGAMGAGLVIRQNGILVVPYHLLKDAYSLQVRFKNGEVFDQVQLMGVDERRDVAAIKITAAALPVIPIAVAAQARTGDAVGVVSHPDGLPWAASTGIAGVLRLSDEVSGAGSGHRLMEFTASLSRAASGEVLLDLRGNALGLIVRAMTVGEAASFAVPIDNVLGLADSPITKIFGNSSTPAPALTPFAAARPINSSAAPVAPLRLAENIAVPNAPEKSDALSNSKDRDFILRNFKTMYVNASRAKYFGSDQLKAQLGRNEEFAKLNIQIVDDPRIADTILEAGYTFAWDYPFELKHQNTTFVLLSGKGLGPFSGIVGAASVAEELAKPTNIVFSLRRRVVQIA